MDGTVPDSRQETAFYDCDGAVEDSDQQRTIKTVINLKICEDMLDEATEEFYDARTPPSHSPLVDEAQVKAVAAVVIEALTAIMFPPRANDLEERVNPLTLSAVRAAVSAMSETAAAAAHHGSELLVDEIVNWEDSPHAREAAATVSDAGRGAANVEDHVVSNMVKAGIETLAPEVAAFQEHAASELAVRLAAIIDERALGVIDDATLTAIAMVVLEATQDGITQKSFAQTARQFGKVVGVVGAEMLAVVGPYIEEKTKGQVEAATIEKIGRLVIETVAVQSAGVSNQSAALSADYDSGGGGVGTKARLLLEIAKSTAGVRLQEYLMKRGAIYKQESQKRRSIVRSATSLSAAGGSDGDGDGDDDGDGDSNVRVLRGGGGVEIVNTLTSTELERGKVSPVPANHPQTPYNADSQTRAEDNLHLLLDPYLQQMNVESTHLIVAAVAEMAGVAAEGAPAADERNKKIGWLAGHIADQLRQTEGLPLAARMQAVLPWEALFPHLLNVNYNENKLEWDVDYNAIVIGAIAPTLLATNKKINFAEMFTFAVELFVTAIIVGLDWGKHECRISSKGIKVQSYFLARLIYAFVMLLLRVMLICKESTIYKGAKDFEDLKEEETEKLRKEHTVHSEDCADHGACTGNDGKCSEHPLLTALRKREKFLGQMIAGLTMARERKKMKRTWYYMLNQLLLLPLMVAYVYGISVVHHLANRNVGEHSGCTVAEGASNAIGLALFLAFWDTVLLLPRLLLALSWFGELIGRCCSCWYSWGLNRAKVWDEDLLSGIPVASNIYKAIYCRNNSAVIAVLLARFEEGKRIPVPKGLSDFDGDGDGYFDSADVLALASDAMTPEDGNLARRNGQGQGAEQDIGHDQEERGQLRQRGAMMAPGKILSAKKNDRNRGILTAVV